MNTSKQFKATTKYRSDWYFLPSIFSGTAGIIIGLAIASVVAWV